MYVQSVHKLQKKTRAFLPLMMWCDTDSNIFIPRTTLVRLSSTITTTASAFHLQRQTGIDDNGREEEEVEKLVMQKTITKSTVFQLGAWVGALKKCHTKIFFFVCFISSSSSNGVFKMVRFGLCFFEFSACSFWLCRGFLLISYSKPSMAIIPQKWINSVVNTYRCSAQVHWYWGGTQSVGAKENKNILKHKKLVGIK